MDQKVLDKLANKEYDCLFDLDEIDYRVFRQEPYGLFFQEKRSDKLMMHVVDHLIEYPPTIAIMFVLQSLPVLKRLYEKTGCDLNAIGRVRKTALIHRRCFNGDIEVVKYLLSLPTANSNLIDEDGYTPIYLVIRSSKLTNAQKLEMVRLLVENGADLSIKSGADLSIKSDGLTPFRLACGMDPYNEELVLYLLSVDQNLCVDGCFTDIDGDNSLHSLANRKCSSVESLQLLLKRKGVDVNMQSKKTNQTALTYARENPFKMKILLEAGADSNLVPNDDYTPLMLAGKYFHLKYGEKFRSTLSETEKEEEKAYRDVISILIEKSNIKTLDYDKMEMTALHFLCASLRTQDLIEQLLTKSKSTVNLRAPKVFCNDTPLQVACCFALSVKTLKTLVKYGADPKIMKKHWTLLDIVGSKVKGADEKKITKIKYAKKYVKWLGIKYSGNSTNQKRYDPTSWSVAPTLEKRSSPEFMGRTFIGEHFRKN